MEINLLPKVSNSKKYRLPITIFIGTALLLFGSFTGYQIWNKYNILNEHQESLEQVKKEREKKQQVLNKEKESIEIIYKYTKEFDRLLNVHIDWVMLNDEVSKQLPKDAKITNMKLSGDGTIQIMADFASLNLIGQYVQLLNQLEWVKIVKVMNVDQKEVKLPTNSDQEVPSELLVPSPTAIKRLQTLIELGVDYHLFVPVGGQG